jgi:hypothetical protein
VNDDQLRDLLRSADPAADLPAADPAAVHRLLEDAMTDSPTDQTGRTGQTGQTGPTGPAVRRARPRASRSLTWLVAAAAVVLIAGGIVLGVTWGGRDDDPAAGDAPPVAETPTPGATSSVAPTVTELTATGAASAGKCLTPEAAPEVVASQDTVLDGVVESISGSKVTLAPTRWYAGDETDLVVVEAPGAELEAALLSAVRFEEGGRYLVSATDGVVTLCAFTAPYSPELAAVYEGAFPR